jgi:rsbT co-antagonist protein RsbR
MTDQPVSPALSQLLLDAAPDAIIAIDRDGTIMFANQQVELTFGWPASELLGKPIETLIPERFRARHQIHRGGYFAYPRIRPMGLGLDLRGLRRDATEFPVEISLSPVPGDLAIATVRDMSARHRVTQERIVTAPLVLWLSAALLVGIAILLMVHVLSGA